MIVLSSTLELPFIEHVNKHIFIYSFHDILKRLLQNIKRIRYKYIWVNRNNTVLISNIRFHIVIIRLDLYKHTLTQIFSQNHTHTYSGQLILVLYIYMYVYIYSVYYNVCVMVSIDDISRFLL